MLNSISALWNVAYIKDTYIYLNDHSIQTMIEIKALYDSNKDDTFANLITSIHVPISFWFIKNLDCFDRYEEYFQDQVERSLNKPYLPHMLHYLQNFKENTGNFASYRLLCTISLGKKIEYLETVEAVMTRLHIEYQILERGEIINVFHFLA